MKRLKSIGLIGMTLIVVPFSATFAANPAQSNVNVGGIYLSVDDYLKDSLSVQADFSKGGKLNFDSFIIRPYVSIVKDGKKEKFAKEKIYAVKTKKDGLYRLFNSEAYLLEEKGQITIYSKVQNSMVKNPYNRLPRYAKYQPQKFFFFSLQPDSPVLPLNQDNLLIALARENNTLSRNMTEAIRETKDLAEYDYEQKMFKVNLLLNSIIRQ
ncbi:MAG: hypothetical protein Q8909_11795 [Bacteroidota bacterium]|nr:hypothetical protein [Bacteroidota bacterium]